MNSRETDRLTKDIKESFDRIQADDALKARTRAYLAQKTNGFRRGAAPAYRRLAAAFACVLLLLLAGGGYSAYFTESFTISVDVNPSVELGINRYDRVISVHSFNEDGAAVIAAKDVRFLDYREAIDALLGTERMESYLTKDSMIGITVFGQDSDKSSEILENLADCTTDYDNVHCSSVSSGHVEDAHSHGMSCGKYQAYLELYALDPTVTVDEVQNLTMSQIWDRIYEMSGSTGTPAQDTGTSNGNGSENNSGGCHDSDRYNGSGGNSGTNANDSGGNSGTNANDSGGNGGNGGNSDSGNNSGSGNSDNSGGGNADYSGGNSGGNSSSNGGNAGNSGSGNAGNSGGGNNSGSGNGGNAGNSGGGNSNGNPNADNSQGVNSNGNGGHHHNRHHR